MGPGFNRGSGGGARGCGFEEQAGAYARTEGGLFPIAHNLSLWFLELLTTTTFSSSYVLMEVPVVARVARPPI